MGGIRPLTICSPGGSMLSITAAALLLSLTASAQSSEAPTSSSQIATPQTTEAAQTETTLDEVHRSSPSPPPLRPRIWKGTSEELMNSIRTSSINLNNNSHTQVRGGNFYLGGHSLRDVSVMLDGVQVTVDGRMGMLP